MDSVVGRASTVEESDYRLNVVFGLQKSKS